MSTRAALAVLLLTATAACGGAPDSGQGPNLRGQVYVSSSVQERGEPRPLVEGTSIELRFTDDNRLLASAGCNQMQGPVTLDDGKISVGELSMTAMGCPNVALNEQDTWLLQLLTTKPEWKLDGTDLVVTGGTAEVVLANEKPATLEGTWTVDGIVAKDSTSSIPAGVKATITFKDGTIAVDTGCNLNGTPYPYELDGKKIKAQLGAVTEKGCTPEGEVEQAVLDALLSTETTYSIDRSTLTLTGASGAGVTLKK
ncbi:META domain-containing protein [Lentzea sp. NPDC058450]|uniref:META domain-containing protein n=1 Tax=Lentzea sp. NPDC058450 TaxID=3346505 RepID=UPI0036495AB6